MIGEKPYLIQSPLFLNGITRAGKFLLGKLASCVKSVEYYQYVSVLEHLPFLSRLGLVMEEAAVALMRVQVDEHAYNHLIGRNMNGRYSDASSIYNAPQFENYLSRSITEDIPALLDHFRSEKRLPTFIIHEMLPNIEIYFKAFRDPLIIDLNRHPIDLAHSWYRRDWGRRYINDPLSFAPVIQAFQLSVPWFAADWKEEYQELKPVDRIIRCIEWLTEEGEKTYRRLDPDAQKKILRITYEQIVEEPEKSVGQIAVFLDAPVLDALPAVMGRERVPQKITSESRKKKLADFEREASPLHLDKLHQMTVAYESMFQK